jgi:hypothetical protein
MTNKQEFDLLDGVSWHPAIQRWRVDIKVGKKSVYLGSRETIEKATQLYNEEKDNVISRYSKEVTSDKAD